MEFETMTFRQTGDGPFWEDNVFGSEIQPRQLTILLCFKQVEEFVFYPF